MDLSSITKLLRDRIGLDPESLGNSALARIVTARLKTRPGMELSDYARQLASDAHEFQVLVDDLAVPETWFFRGGELFSYLASHIRDACCSTSSQERYRVLSIPCSTGEEPFSLAISLLEVSVPANAWSIDGVDISSRHIEQARGGMFREFSFRQTEASMKDRYFQKGKGGLELQPRVRELVKFHQGNLFDQPFVLGESTFDLIFCRNLLIYLHADARRRAIDILHRMLRPRGILCMGHAEPLESTDRRFEQTGPAECFLFRRLESIAIAGDTSIRRKLDSEAVSPFAIRSDKPSDAASSRHTKTPSIVNPKEPARKSVNISGNAPATSRVSLKSSDVSRVREKPTAPSSADPAALILLARQRADEGQLDDALSMCESQLKNGVMTADLYSLIGVIQQAKQESEKAMNSFEKALYLDPSHREALTHLMVLAQGRGDEPLAERLRRRLDRVAKRGAS